MNVCACQSLVTSDLCGWRPVAVILLGVGWRSGRVVIVRINMSAVQLLSVFLSSSVTVALPHLSFSLPTLSLLFLLNCILLITLFHFSIPRFVCKSSPSFYVSFFCASFLPIFAPHGHSPFCKFIFPTLNHCLHLPSSSSLSLAFSLSSSLPLSLSFEGRSLFLYITNLSKRHILLFSFLNLSSQLLKLH